MIRGVLRWVLAAFYAAAGYLHLVRPEPFLSIMPSWVPAPEAVVLWTGVAELLGAAALVNCPISSCKDMGRTAFPLLWMKVLATIRNGAKSLGYLVLLKR